MNLPLPVPESSKQKQLRPQNKKHMKYHLFKFVLVLATLASISPAQAFTTFYYSGPGGFTLGGNYNNVQTNLSVSFWSPYRFGGAYGYGWAGFGWPHGWGRPAWGVPSYALPSYQQMKANRQYAEELAQQKIATAQIPLDENTIREKQKKILENEQKEFDSFERGQGPEIRRAPSLEQKPQSSSQSKDGSVTVNYY